MAPSEALLVIVLLELGLVVPVVVVFIVELNWISLNEAIEILVKVFSRNDLALEALFHSCSLYVGLFVDDRVIDWRL